MEEEITSEEAYDLVKDELLLDKKHNKNARYYKVNLGDINIYSWKGKPLLTGATGLFVVKDETVCVTFKTTIESEIYSQLQRFAPSRRMNRLAR